MEGVIGNLWNNLSKLPPDNVCKRTLASVDESGNYIVKYLNFEYRVNIKKQKIENLISDPQNDQTELSLLILSYLIHTQDISLTNRWISEKSLKGGKLFFQGVHQLPTRSLINLFGKNIELFHKVGIKLGGIQKEYGDLAFEFIILPKMPLICILWLEDEVIEGADSVILSWYFKATEKEGSPSHVHEDFDEIVGFIGNDPQNPLDLGAEVEFWIEDEKYILDKSCLIWIPKGLRHCPLRVVKVERPILFLAFSTTKKYGKDGVIEGAKDNE